MIIDFAGHGEPDADCLQGRALKWSGAAGRDFWDWPLNDEANFDE
jgi:hypothetical protein